MGTTVEYGYLSLKGGTATSGLLVSHDEGDANDMDMDMEICVICKLSCNTSSICSQEPSCMTLTLHTGRIKLPVAWDVD